MTTRYIGITELRRSMPTIARRSKAKKERFILQSKDGICFELRPVVKAVAKKGVPTKKPVYKKEFLEGLKQAIADSDAGGRVYTTEQVRKHFSL